MVRRRKSQDFLSWLHDAVYVVSYCLFECAACLRMRPLPGPAGNFPHHLPGSISRDRRSYAELGETESGDLQGLRQVMPGYDFWSQSLFKGHPVRRRGSRRSKVCGLAEIALPSRGQSENVCLEGYVLLVVKILALRFRYGVCAQLCRFNGVVAMTCLSVL